MKLNSISNCCNYYFPYIFQLLEQFLEAYYCNNLPAKKIWAVMMFHQARFPPPVALLMKSDPIPDFQPECSLNSPQTI